MPANHPSNFSFFAPLTPDRKFPTSNQEALLRRGDRGAPALTSELLRLLPQNFLANHEKLRYLLTTDSSDYELPGVTPWVWNNPYTDPTYNYVANGAFPTGPAIAFPTTAQRGNTQAGSEFDGNTWRAVSAALNRLDLSRQLVDYPTFNANTGLIAKANLAQFNLAQTTRQQLAQDLYTILIQTTGARDPNNPQWTVPAGFNLANAPTDFQAARWLAQLAVNIVDYLDDDDYMTPFNWFNRNGQSEWVYGTELPRVLLSEGYAQQDNDSTDAGILNGNANLKKATHYQLNVWAELHNPFKTTPAGSTFPLNGGTAQLQYPTTPPGGQIQVPYQLLVALQAANNTIITPSNTTGQPTGAQMLITLNRWGTTNAQKRILPANGNYSGPSGGETGFYVVGPQANFLPGRNPNLPVTISTQTLSLQQSLNILPPTVTMLLQRLTCPNMPSQPNPQMPYYNPYITVDVLANVPVNNAHVYTGVAGQILNPLPPSSWSTVGRRQPYAGNVSNAAQLVPQAPNPPLKNQPQNTFFRLNGTTVTAPKTANATLTMPFNWLTHLDRPLISPLELLYVSAYPPHRLTEKFGVAPPSGHYAPWFTQASRIYRFLEFVKTHDRGAGNSITTGSNAAGYTTASRFRLPGKVNVNTIWEPEVFYALLDNPAQAPALYSNMIGWRSQNLTSGTIGPTWHHQADTAANKVDRPFNPFSVGFTTGAAGSQYPNNIGLNNTLLTAGAAGPGGTPLLSVPGAAHPYQQNALLTKLFNNVTTRSNVFAVWVTVGFFEVTNETVRPATLGAELYRNENRHLRHRFFAIIDRTGVDNSFYAMNGTTFTSATISLVNNITVTNGVPVTTTITLNNAQPLFTVSGNRIKLEVGSRLVVNQGAANEEVVVVTAVNNAATPTQLTAVFRHTHAAGEIIRYQGHPGPWNTPTLTSYNPRRDTGVVLHLSVLD